MADLPKLGSRWTRKGDDDGRVYICTLARRHGIMAGSGPQIIFVEERTGYPRCHVSFTQLQDYWTEVARA